MAHTSRTALENIDISDGVEYAMHWSVNIAIHSFDAALNADARWLSVRALSHTSKNH